MDYKKHYDILIERSKTRVLEGYSEKHHILPRCMGGSDLPSNIVKLSAREHFVAHLLLVKIYPGNTGLVKAAAMMCVGQENRKITNRMYGWLKDLFRASMRESQSGCKNSQYNTRWINDGSLSKKINREDPTPEGWFDGRKKKEKVRKVTATETKKRKYKELYTEYYLLYSKFGFNKLVEMTGYSKSKSNLVMMFSRHVKEYKPQNGKKRGIS
jgi:hypothetical protein